MTPLEVRALSVPEYLSMLRYMDAEARELKRAQNRRGRRG